MASCAVCGTTILFGGKSHSGMRFCSDVCAANGQVLAVANTIPDAEVIMLASKIHGGKCPKCSGPGPVEVHSAYEAMSFVLMTQWKTVQQISCRSCGIKKQALSSLKTVLLGWWGFPWGTHHDPDSNWQKHRRHDQGPQWAAPLRRIVWTSKTDARRFQNSFELISNIRLMMRHICPCHSPKS
jgi:hypothetical protein